MLAVQHEKEIEKKVLRIFGEHPEALAINNSTSSARTLADLLCGSTPTIFHDTNEFNTHPKLMQDVVGGMTPDIALRSRLSGENRIYIETKDTEALGYGIDDSQIIRYFLHLLAVSTRVPPGAPDIRRAVLLCAPRAWFSNPSTAKSWRHFLQHFSGLAKAFDITLGELHADSF